MAPAEEANEPFAPASEPDGMSQLASIDADAAGRSPQQQRQREPNSMADADYGVGSLPAVEPLPAELQPEVLAAADVPTAQDVAAVAADADPETASSEAEARQGDTSLSGLPVSDPSVRLPPARW